MVGDKAVRLGQEVPQGYKQMETVVCRTCISEFVIIHQLPFAHSARAKNQVIRVESILAGDHVDSKQNAHLDSYEDLDDD
jgi:hypothetical protein